jgi:hypothetical protein
MELTLQGKKSDSRPPGYWLHVIDHYTILPLKKKVLHFIDYWDKEK